MITFTTKFHGPTITRGSRISCTAPGRTWRVSVPYDHGSTDTEKHARAVAAFVIKHMTAPGEGGRKYHYGHGDAGVMRWIPLDDGDSVKDSIVLYADGSFKVGR